jgi:hypothetical protein
VKQVAHLDAGAGRQRRRFHIRLHAAIDGDAPGMRLAPVPRRDRHAGGRADRWQRLAAESKGADREQILFIELRGGVTFDRQAQVRAGHAGAVVRDADEAASAAVGQHIDPAGAGIERVFDQLFDDAGRALDHLAGGDAVDRSFGQLADGHRRDSREGQ